MILTKKEILDLINTKKLKIDPFNRKNIGIVGIDLGLGNEFRIFNKRRVSINSDYKKISKKVKKDEIILKPGDFILGITKEKITLPENVIGLLEGRSRYARLGLIIHVTAPIIYPGVHNKQVLEIKNLSNMEIKIKAGTKLCQLVLMETKSEVKYKGHFSKQNSL
jgi:dCTP deaminase